MTFLEPFILWGIPLALLPVIIHLFNRLRHRSVDWGAMMFLLSMTRKSTRFAKLRQWLILLFRVLALLVLILAVARPLAGGWVGWALRPAPDAILLVLDRSTSMEARLANGQISKREDALRLLGQAAKTFQDTSRLVLFDSALRTPQEIGDSLSLPQLSLAAATDTAADLPATLQVVLDWLQRNKPGNVEIWIASDLQRSNWRPESERWTALSAQLAAFPQSVRVRLLALDQPPTGESASISVLEVNRRYRSQPPEVEVVLDIERNNPAPVTLPLVFSVDGNRSQTELQLQGQSFRYRHKILLENAQATGWGKVEIPADDNPRDNTAYFVYGPPVAVRSAVVASEDAVGRILALAAAPIPSDTNRVADVLAPDKAESVNWNPYAAVLWAGPSPSESVAAKLMDYAKAGGSVLVFPPSGQGRFDSVLWGPVENAEADKNWKVARWEEKEGPLVKTEEGLSLPLGELLVTRRQTIGGEKGIVATFEDGSAFLTRRVVGRGQILFCATSPQGEWSDLRDGVVLVPLVQRLVQSGGRRFTQASLVECGETGAGDGAEAWTSLEGVKDIRVQAGVYRSQTRLVAVNRPLAENDPETVEPSKARALLGSVKVQLFSEGKQGETRLQSELWRTLLFLMLGFLLVESILVLPPKLAGANAKGED